MDQTGVFTLFALVLSLTPSQRNLPMSLINTEVLPFKATAYKNGEFVEVTNADLKGKWSVVFF